MAEVFVPDDVMNLVEAREAARKDKDYGAADRLRDEVLALGFVIEDTREGPKVVRAASRSLVINNYYLLAAICYLLSAIFAFCQLVPVN